MTSPLITEIPLAWPYTRGNYDGMDIVETYGEARGLVALSLRTLVIRTRFWAGGPGWSGIPVTREGGFPLDPDAEECEVYSNPTPAFVVMALREAGLKFGAHDPHVGVLAVDPAPGGIEVNRTSNGVVTRRVVAEVHGFTPAQIETINAWTDAA